MTGELIKEDDIIEVSITWKPGVDQMKVVTTAEVRVDARHSFLVVKVRGKPINLKTRLKTKADTVSGGAIIVLDGVSKCIEVTALQMYPGDGQVTVVPLMRTNSTRLDAQPAATTPEAAPVADRLTAQHGCEPRSVPKALRHMVI